MPEETPKPASSEPVTHPPDQSPPDSPPKKQHGWIVWVIVGVVLVLGFIGYRMMAGGKKPTPTPQPVPVATATARKGDIGVNVDALGAVTPLATVSVPSQVAGQLTKINFVEGQMVKAGDVLAEIDDRPYQAVLKAAEGQLERDQALLAEARMDLKRYQAAFEQHAVPKQQLDDQQALVDQEVGTVKYDQGQVDSAKVQVGYCHITAYISGRIGLRLLDPGNIVLSTSTNGLAVITQLQPISVFFSVAEDYLPAIQHQLAVGHTMTVQAFDRAQQTNLASGVVIALDNLIDAGTGTIRIRASFPNETLALFPNQFVNARLLIDTLHDQTLIPSATIQRNGQATFVFIVQSDETVEMRPVKVGATDGDTTAVDGVKPGEVLVADNFNRLQDKGKVTVRKPGDAKKTTGG
jgi:multidrug efflux system membrane fusion protein